MSESLAPLRAMPAATRWLASLLVAAISIITSLSACIVYAQSFVQEVEMREAITAHKREEEAREEVRQKQRDAERRVQLERDTALFRRLVSLEAADVEPDRRKAAGAAAHARKAYDNAIMGGMQPSLAAQHALDDLPPWRK